MIPRLHIARCSSQLLGGCSRVRPTMPLRAKVQVPSIASRSMASQSSTPPNYKGAPAKDDDVLFHQAYGVRSIELNRPSKLNSLNYSMASKILPRLQEWEKSELASVIVIKGAGDRGTEEGGKKKAFCAGGDVMALAEQNKTGPEGQRKSMEFFELEYRLDHYIATYPKPYVAYMDGITMGGGVGLSLHGSFRIATERTVFAMPETTIGFFPDVGASFFLPRMDGQIGTYLALTSDRLVGAQAFYAGVATHYVHSSTLADMEARLGELRFDDRMQLHQRLDLVNDTIEEFVAELPDDEPIHLGGELRQSIDRCFKYNTVDEILKALNAEGTEWASKTASKIRQRSPTSARVTLREMRYGPQWGIDEAFAREHVIATRFMEHPRFPDFVEGVTKQLSKYGRGKPQWSPATLEDTPESIVDAFFDTAGQTKMEFVKKDSNYTSYPHSWVGLPSENAIRSMVKQKPMKRVELIEQVLKEWKGKKGVAEKMEDVISRKVEFDPENGLARWID